MDITPIVPIVPMKDKVVPVDIPASFGTTMGGLQQNATTSQIGSGNEIFKIDPQLGIHLGAADFADAPFSVTLAGVLHATSGTFSGDITGASGTFTGTISATSGSIGGFTIGATDLSATSGGNTTILSSGATALSAGPTGSPTVTITQGGDILATSVVTLSGTTTILSPNITTTAVVAGESITAGNAVCLINDLFQIGRGGSVNFGDVSGNTRQAIKIVPRSSITSSSIKVYMKKVGAPTDNITIEVQTDSAGDPSGTPVTNGTSNNFAGSGLTTTGFVESTISFSSAFSLTSGTTYWLVFKRSTAVDGSNYYVIETNNGGVYASFTGKKYDGGSWSSSSNAVYFQMVLASGTPSITAWKTDTDTTSRLYEFFGFAGLTVSAGSTVTITIAGANTNQSGLTKGSLYYLSDTAGAISSTPQAFINTPVGRALSSTDILILPPQQLYYTGQSSRTSGSGTGDQVITHILGKPPKLIKIRACQDLGTGGNISDGHATSTSSRTCTVIDTSQAGTNVRQFNDRIIALTDASGADRGTADISNISTTTFTLTWSTGVTVADCMFEYELYA